jgi:CrcB protein
VLDPSFPWGTLAVNVLGSFFMGLFVPIGHGSPHLSATARLALTTGVLGGFTTYSAFNEQTLGFARQGAWALAAANVGATLAGCLLAGALGIAGGRWLFAAY